MSASIGVMRYIIETLQSVLPPGTPPSLRTIDGAPVSQGKAELAPDVVRLVIAARAAPFLDVAWDEEDRIKVGELDAACEAFADRVPWEDQPDA